MERDPARDRLPAVGDEQTVGYEELLAASKAGFEDVPDFTRRGRGGVRAARPGDARARRPLRGGPAGGAGTDLEPHLVGELIASEVEVRTGRCDTFVECVERVGERRAQLRALVDPLGVGLSSAGRIRGARGRSSASSTRRTTAATTSCCATSSGATTPSGCTCTSASTAPTARFASPARCATILPELLAVSASSPFVEGVFTHLHSARTQIFTRMFPRCGIPDSFEGWDDWESYVRFLYETGSVTEHTQMWWSVRPHLHVPDGRDPHLRRAARSRRGALARGAHLLARPRGSHARVDEGEPLPSWPHRLLEENLWRAIRQGLSGELIDLERGESIPARARLEQLARMGAAGRRRARRLAVARDPRAERGRAADRPPRGGRDDGGDLRRAGAGR